jgi:transposase
LYVFERLLGFDAVCRRHGSKTLRQRPALMRLLPCVVGMEACATAHQWARELKMLGHDTWLMPPSYVKAYVKCGKNDAADAAAICEAVTRPPMRFVCRSKALGSLNFNITLTCPALT